nr:MAG TPA: hypothetical protein [Caudoviricetes sp.]
MRIFLNSFVISDVLLHGIFFTLNYMTNEF